MKKKCSKTPIYIKKKKEAATFGATKSTAATFFYEKKIGGSFSSY